MHRSVLAITGTVLFITFTLVMTWRHSATKEATGKHPQTKQATLDPSPSADSLVRNDVSLRSGARPRASAQPSLVHGPTGAWNAGADSPDEQRTKSRAGKSTRTPRNSGSQADFLADALFRQLDVNGDGMLTGSEIPTEFRDEVNESGAIDSEKFAKLFNQVVEKLRDGRLTPPTSIRPAGLESLTGALPDWFKSLDPNGTGRVTLSRWRAAGRSVAQFQRMDADGDEVLTWREVRAYLSQSGAPAAGHDGARAGTTDPDRSPSTRGAFQTAQDNTNSGAELTRADALLAYYGTVAAGLRPPTMANFVVSRAGAKPRPKVKPAPPAPVAIAPAMTSQPASPPPPAPPEASDGEVATLPLPLTGNSYWEQRDNEHVTALAEGARPNVLFLGDSITDFLLNAWGEPMWDGYFAPLNSLNFGVGGIRTSQVLWQIETGEVAMAAPKVIVLLIGSNNLGIGQQPDEVAAGIEKIVSELGDQLPDTKILLLGLLPRGFKADDPYRAKIEKVNSLIADLHDGNRVTYLDFGQVFLSKDGSISPDIMPDGLHPNLSGYIRYTEAVLPALTDLLPKK